MTALEQERELLSVELPAKPESIATARHAVSAVARGVGVEPFDVAVATSEAVTNAVKHGYRERDEGSIRIRALSNDDLIVEVVDAGAGMTPDLSRKGLGLGLPIIGAMTSEFRVEDAEPGVRICMFFDRSA